MRTKRKTDAQAIEGIMPCVASIEHIVRNVLELDGRTDKIVMVPAHTAFLLNDMIDRIKAEVDATDDLS